VPDIREAAALEALGAVVDPELDQPITDLDFVQSVTVSGEGDVVVHLRLPTSFCAPNFAYLMASDAKDVLTTMITTIRRSSTPGSPPMRATAVRSRMKQKMIWTSSGRPSSGRPTSRRWSGA
jgi:metal-sulfur cluster biosynthetic enzyme